MKKLIILIASLSVALGFTACDLDITPDTAITGPDAARLKYVQGMRAGVYNDMTTLTSPVYTINDEYQSDLFVQTDISGNRGGYFHRWELYASDQDVRGQWYAYYSVVAGINYALGKCAETSVSSDAAKEELALYVAELHFFRAYVLNQVAVHFCEAYDPAKAASQPGIPYPTTYAPGTGLARGTLQNVYSSILEDLKIAEAGVTTAGSANSVYLTADAVTAFKARVALQMKNYADAIKFASSLYAKYPLVNSKDALGRMWTADISTETIMQFLVSTTTLSLVSNSNAYDFTLATWTEATKSFVFDPSDVPCKWVEELFSQDDWRYGTYVDVLPTKQFGEGMLMIKLAGNESLRSTPTRMNYCNMPKLFRIAEMYLIEAEAQYFKGGDAKQALNQLRAKRGLTAVNSSGAALLQDIKDEYIREFIGEGYRMSCLKRWGDGFTREAPAFVAGHTAAGYNLKIAANDYRFTWPIPQIEIQNNPAISPADQNEGYK